MDASNPNAPTQAKPLAPQHTVFENLLNRQFQKSSINRLAIDFPLSSSIFRLSLQIHTIPGVFETLKQFPHVSIVDVEVVVNTFHPDMIVAACLTHDIDMPATFDGIVAQKSHFVHRVTPLSGSTVVKSFPFYSGMSRQLQPPTPLDGTIPVFSLWTNIVGEGVVSLIINFDYGGSLILKPVRFVPINIPSPVPEPPKPTPTDPVEADGPLILCDSQNRPSDLNWRAYTNDRSALVNWFKDEVLRHGMTEDDIPPYTVEAFRIGGGVGLAVLATYDKLHKLFRVGKTIHTAYRIMHSYKGAQLLPSDKWWFGIIREDDPSTLPPPTHSPHSSKVIIGPPSGPSKLTSDTVGGSPILV
jgi:hypothetical protein